MLTHYPDSWAFVAPSETSFGRHAKYSLLGPQLSPDDRWIAFHATLGSTRQVYVAPVSEGSVTPEDRWIPIDGMASQPFWSPDGANVFFLSNRDLFVCLLVQPLDLSDLVSWLESEVLPA